MAVTTESEARRFDIKSYIPILEWLPNYERKWLRPDLIAALTVWALLVIIFILILNFRLNQEREGDEAQTSYAQRRH